MLKGRRSITRRNQNRTKAVRICTLLLFCLLVLSFVPPNIQSRFSREDLGGQVSVSVAVPANPYNTVAKQLAEKDAKLAEKEQGLAKQFADVSQIAISIESLKSLMAILAIFLFGLTGLNFFLDYRYRNHAKQS